MSADETHLMQPLEQAIKRAGLLLANIQASRWEAIPRLEPAKAIREEEHFTIRMGMSSEYFRRQVVNHALFRIRTGPAWIRTRCQSPMSLRTP
jgi:hypothetical protein